MIASEPAVPYVELTLENDRYRLSPNLPATNRADVTAAPTHTSRQAISASGTNLSSAANTSVITTKETARLAVSRISADIPPGAYASISAPNVVSSQLITSDASSRNTIPMSMANDRSRLTRNDWTSD